jgi:hypothetical protein
VEIDLAERLRSLSDIGQRSEQGPTVSQLGHSGQGRNEFRSAGQSLLHSGRQNPQAGLAEENVLAATSSASGSEWIMRPAGADQVRRRCSRTGMPATR